MPEFTEKQIQAALNWAKETEKFNQTCKQLAEEYQELKQRYRDAQDSYRQAKARASCALPYEACLEVPTVMGSIKIERCLDDFDIVSLPYPDHPFITPPKLKESQS